MKQDWAMKHYVLLITLPLRVQKTGIMRVYSGAGLAV